MIYGADEGVASFLLANRRAWSVPGIHGGLVWEHEKPFFDGSQQRAAIATGEIGTADAKLEKGVAAEENGLGWCIQAYAALGVARGVDNFEGDFAYDDLVAIG